MPDRENSPWPSCISYVAQPNAVARARRRGGARGGDSLSPGGAAARHARARLLAEAARRAALLEFGGIDRAKERGATPGPGPAWPSSAPDCGWRSAASVNARPTPSRGGDVALAIGAAGAIINALWTVPRRGAALSRDHRLVRWNTPSSVPATGWDCRRSRWPITARGHPLVGEAGLIPPHGFTLLGHGERAGARGVVSP